MGVPLQLSSPIDQLMLAPLNRNEYWKIVATAVWGGIWWSSQRGEAFIGILKGNDNESAKENPLQIYSLTPPSEAKINHRCHPVFLAGRHHAVLVTPSNTKLSHVVAWPIDVNGNNAYKNGGNESLVQSWLLREITSTPTIQDNWLACVSTEQSELSVQVRLFPESTPDTTMPSTPQSVLTLVNLNQTDRLIYQFVDIGNTAYHLHGMDQQNAIIFVHQLQERSNMLCWQLGYIDMKSHQETQGTSPWCYRSKGQINLTSPLSRYLFTSKPLDIDRVLLQGSNLFGTNGCLALIDVSIQRQTSSSRDASSINETGFVWLNNHLYKMVVPLVSANKIIACPPSNEPDNFVDENTAAFILDLNTGHVLVSISGANWAQVEPIFGNLIAIGVTNTWGLSECFILDISMLTLTNTEVNEIITSTTTTSSSRWNSTRHGRHRLFATYLPSSIRKYSFNNFKIRSASLSMTDSMSSVTSGLSSFENQQQQQVMLLKYTCYGLWHVSPTALMSSFIIKSNNDEPNYTLKRRLTNNNVSINQLATEPEPPQEKPFYLRHFAYSLY
jgi:hypothetical protein